MKRIALVFFDAGGGHRNAALALEASIKQQNLPFEVSLVNLQETLDRLDILRRFTGVRIQDFYNLMLRRGWTLGSPQLMRVLQVFVRLFHRPAVRALGTFWRENEMDLVVSLVPHFNRALCESFTNVFPARPFATVLTDLADYPPHFWIERQRQYVICGTGRAVEQAREMGHPPEEVFRASGMILHPRFYEPDRPDRAAERVRLGLDPGLPTAILLFGGHGSWNMLDIVRRLDRSSLDLQLILICGRNGKLVQKLRREKTRLRMFVEGFTKQIPHYMHLSDFFIGKPGPGSISEALAKRLPVIVDCNAWTLPQERYNAQWVRENGVGLVVRSHKEIERATEELLRPGRLEQFRERTAAFDNRAVFEIPKLFEKILSAAPVLKDQFGGNAL